MPTQTKFVCPSGGVNVDLSGIFAELNGGTSYGTATNLKVGANDINTLFHASTSVDDRPSFNTGYRITVGGVATDLSAIFRRRGFVGITITTQPTTQIINNNASATFSIAATAAGTPTYQWYKNNSIISGATSTTYTTGALTTANDTDTYFCRVSYSGSSVDSNSVTTRIKPYIITHPVGGNFNDGDGMSLSIVAGGSPTLSYQWFKDGNQINGATSSSYPASGQFTLNSASKGTYTCKVTSTYDQVGQTSNGATLTIIVPDISLGITNYNPPFVFQYDTVITLTVTKTAGSNVTYAWSGPNGNITNGQGGYTLLNGDTQLQFTLSASNDGLYSVTATNGGGSDTSTATISIIPPEVSIGITNYNPPFIFGNGNEITITSTLSQGLNVTYQWYGPNGSIQNATGATYQFSLSDSTDGNYYVVATNAGGSDTSNTITISLIQYTLTVNNGSVTNGSGTQNDGFTYNISAAAAPEGEHFAYWSVDSGTANIANIYQGDTSCTISSNATISANYEAD